VVKTSCVGCHADPEEDGTFTGIFAFDVNRFTYHTMPKYQGKGYTGASQTDLTKFIAVEMLNCGGTCARNAAAYLWSLRRETHGVSIYSCNTSSPVLYGQRNLKLLTNYEYHNSLQALFKAPLPDDFSTPKRTGDLKVVSMPNNPLETNESRLNTYDKNAEELAKWAVATPDTLGFDCAEKTSCATDFVNRFAYFAFRRPLTLAERTEYRDIISASHDLTAGLQRAIHSVLMSPQFLYRSELGMKVSEARTRMTEESTYADVIQGNPITSLTMPGIPYDTDGFGHYGAYENVGLVPSYNWTGDDIVTLSVKADGSEWGRLVININGNNYYAQDIKSATAKIATLRVQGFAGTGHDVQAYNESGNPIAVGKITVGPTVFIKAPTETIPHRDLIDANAYVLNAFEYAGALSYRLTGSPPDDLLMNAAFAGDLGDKAKVEQHIDRMLDSSLGKMHMDHLTGGFGTDIAGNINNKDSEAFIEEVNNSLIDMTCTDHVTETAYNTRNGSIRAVMKALGLSDAVRYRR